MLLWAAACAIPGLVAMRGACIVYRRALLGLSTAQEEQALSQTLASAMNRARGLRDPFAPKVAGPVAGAATDAGAAVATAWQPPSPQAFPAPPSSLSPAVAALPADQRLDGETAQVHPMVRAMGGGRDAPVPSSALPFPKPGASPELVSRPAAAHAHWPQQPHALAAEASAAAPPSGPAWLPPSPLGTPRASGQTSWAPQLSTAAPGRDAHHQQQHHQTPPQPAWLQPPPASATFTGKSTQPVTPAAATPDTMATAPLDLDLDLDLEASYAGASSSTSLISNAAPSPLRNTTTQKICPFCGGDTELADLFCGHCGQPLPK